jgi:PilZ domain
MLEAGQSVLVSAGADDAPWRMVVDVVQEGQVTLATHEAERLPPAWSELTEVHITSLDRYNVHLIHVPVRRVGETRLVVGEPDDATPVQRRAYARIASPVPASCMYLDVGGNAWIPFDSEIRDLGGGGCSLLADVFAPDGATVVLSFVLDEPTPVVLVGRVLPREVLPTVGKVLTRVEFVLIREADRDRILRHVLLTSARRHAPQHPLFS